jgi:peptidoglycan/LPS O-acetylase OafA/YrhL
VKPLVITAIAYFALALAIAFAPPVNGFVPVERLGLYVLGAGVFVAALFHLQARKTAARRAYETR